MFKCQSENKTPKFLTGLASGLLTVFFAFPSYANTITLVSDSNTKFAASGTENLGVMNAAVASSTYPTPSLPVVVGRQGTGIYQIPGTDVINSNPSGWWYGLSGYYETSFDLPTGFSNVTLDLLAVGDDGGSAFLNQTYLGDFFWNGYGAYSFSTANQSLFHAGTNLLTFTVSNWGAGPTGLSYKAEINYGAPSAVPLPAALPLILSGLGVLGFASRRRKETV